MSVARTYSNSWPECGWIGLRPIESNTGSIMIYVSQCAPRRGSEEVLKRGSTWRCVRCRGVYEGARGGEPKHNALERDTRKRTKPPCIRKLHLGVTNMNATRNGIRKGRTLATDLTKRRDRTSS